MKNSYLLKIITMNDDEARAFEPFGINIEIIAGSQTQVDFVTDLTDEEVVKIQTLPGLIRIHKRAPHPV